MNQDPSLIQQGLELLYFGMGTVVVFLGLLVLFTTLMSWLVQRFGVDAATHAPAPGEDSTPSPEVIAAISAAIHKHRRR